MDVKEKTIDIKELITKLLDVTIESGEAEEIINRIHNFFEEITSVSGYEFDVKRMAAVPTASGMALSLNHAAQCLLDYKRTVLFLRGIVTAINDKQKLNPGKIVEIFYAGCGPYAPFISLVAPLFSSKEVQFTLLEINKDSLDLAKKVINALELSDYIKAYHLADAVLFQLPDPEDYDILFSETLDALLYRESYVPILRNMLPQFSDEITLIPENVRLDLNFKIEEENTLKEVYAGPVFDTRKAISTDNELANTTTQFPAVKFELDSKIKHNSFLLDTEVHIYKDFYLKRGESSLTLPFEMAIDFPLKYKTVVFIYHLQPQVELKCTFE
jgi:predicted RNA methylase